MKYKRKVDKNCITCREGYIGPAIKVKIETGTLYRSGGLCCKKKVFPDGRFPIFLGVRNVCEKWKRDNFIYRRRR